MYYSIVKWNGIIFSLLKEWNNIQWNNIQPLRRENLVTCDNMDEHEGHYTK